MVLADDITPEMRRFPHYKYMLMALFDTLYNLLGAFPTPHIGYVVLSIWRVVLQSISSLV